MIYSRGVATKKGWPSWKEKGVVILYNVVCLEEYNVYFVVIKHLPDTSNKTITTAKRIGSVQFINQFYKSLQNPCNHHTNIQLNMLKQKAISGFTLCSPDTNIRTNMYLTINPINLSAYYPPSGRTEWVWGSAMYQTIHAVVKYDVWQTRNKNEHFCS